MIKIILVDDHHIVRQGIRTLLELEHDITVIGETDQQEKLINFLETDKIADVVIVDINMPDVDGITLTKTIKQLHPGVRVIVLSMMDHEKYVAQAFKAGVNAFMIKNVSREELLFAIRFVAQGEYYICAEISMKLLHQAMKIIPLQTPVEITELQISNREMEVLTLTADGFTNQEIAERLFTSKRTVEGYRQSLLEKTGVRNTAALIKYAFQNGLLK